MRLHPHPYLIVLLACLAAWGVIVWILWVVAAAVGL